MRIAKEYINKIKQSDIKVQNRHGLAISIGLTLVFVFIYLYLVRPELFALLLK